MERALARTNRERATMNKPVNPQSTKLKDMPMLIGGKLVASESGRWMDSVNPANEEIIGRVPQGSEKDVDAAVKAAEAAQPEWAALAVNKRADYLIKLSDGMAKRA